MEIAADGRVGSAFLHAAAFLLIGMSLRGCQSLGQGTPGGEPFREIGLVVVDGVDGGAAATGTVAGAGEDAETVEANEPAEMESDVPSDLTEPGRVANRIPSEAPDIESLLSSSNGIPLRTGKHQAIFPR